MGLSIYNTLTRRKEAFTTLEPGRVRMYVCGPNLYGPCHVGHALSYVVFDVLRRYLEYRGYEVIHVQNFTDVEDRIIEVANAENTTIQALAERYIERFFREMDALNVKRATHYPRATEAIPKMIELISGLIEKGHAYVVDGDVYFRVTSFPSYGKLSGRSLEEMQAGTRIEVDPRKEHPMDFALWKAAKPGEPSWESPWGPGRPGWHIECSAMSIQFLGEQLDIHGGGQDVIFPHHENEIAQSESFTGKAPFARFWVHNGLLRPREDQEKMTRHLGNIVTIEQALERFSPNALRLFFLSSHYRSPLTWSEEGVWASERGFERLLGAVENVEVLQRRFPPDPSAPLDEPARELDAQVARARERFLEAMDDDLNTPVAIAALFDLATEMNRLSDALVKGSPQIRNPGGAMAVLVKAKGTLQEFLEVLGFRLERPVETEELLSQLWALWEDLEKRHPELVSGVGLSGGSEGADLVHLDGVLEAILLARQRAREARDWATADGIRARLQELGIVLEDLPAGTRWRIRGRARS